MNARLALLLLAGPSLGLATEPAPIAALEDNSFLIEEAYNQEPGVVQQYLVVLQDRSTRGLVISFTQEWPVPAETHQLSYTLNFLHAAGPDGARGLGDVLLNYRYQAILGESFAFAPRLSAVIPGGAAEGYQGVGAQAMLPLSIRATPWLSSHTNAGFTWVPHGHQDGAAVDLRVWTIGEGLVWLVRPRLNLLVELLWNATERNSHQPDRVQSLVVSPGVRWGIDLPGDVQVVLGAAAPLGVGPGAGSWGLLGYLSVEAPFWRPAPAAP
jgi:hypothetical protein